MTPALIIQAIKSLKSKNSEGFDHFPAHVLIDSVSKTLPFLQQLVSLIYKLKQMPQKLLTSKVIPIHKKEISVRLKTIAGFLTCV